MWIIRQSKSAKTYCNYYSCEAAIICHITRVRSVFFPQHYDMKHILKFKIWLLKIWEEISQMICSWTRLQIVRQHIHGQLGIKIVLAAGAPGHFSHKTFMRLSFFCSVKIHSQPHFLLPFPKLVTALVRGPHGCLVFRTCRFTLDLETFYHHLWPDQVWRRVEKFFYYQVFCAKDGDQTDCILGKLKLKH